LLARTLLEKQRTVTDDGAKAFATVNGEKQNKGKISFR
jgi:hypothetical protein